MSATKQDRVLLGGYGYNAAFAGAAFLALWLCVRQVPSRARLAPWHSVRLLLFDFGLGSVEGSQTFFTPCQFILNTNFVINISTVVLFCLTQQIFDLNFELCIELAGILPAQRSQKYPLHCRNPTPHRHMSLNRKARSMLSRLSVAL